SFQLVLAHRTSWKLVPHGAITHPRLPASAAAVMQKGYTPMPEGNGRSWSNEIVDLGDKIANLKVVQAVELGNYLEEKYGIKAAAGGVVMAAGPATAAEAPKAEEKTEFTVTLDGLADPAKKINVIK